MRAVWRWLRARFRLRFKLILASLALILSPLLVVWPMGIVEDIWKDQIVREVSEHSSACLAEAARRELDVADLANSGDWLNGFARDRSVMIRVLDSDGRVRLRTSPQHAERWATNRSWWRDTSDFFFGPAGAPDLAAFDASLGPESRRPEVRAALAGRRADAWHHAGGARMLVYDMAEPLPDGAGVLYITRTSRRAIRSLYEVRYQLLNLTLYLTLAALLFAAYIGWRMVAPLRRMQRQIAGYLRNPHSRDLESLALDRSDEIGDLSRAFDELTRRLRAQVEERAGVAGDLAHDLKNPIAAVAAAAELLEDGPDLSPDRRARLAAALEDAAAHMNGSVEGLLTLARLDASLAESDFSAFRFTDLVERVVTTYEESPQWEQVTFGLRAPAGAVQVVGVEEQLETLVRNLIDNALAFCESEVRLAIEHGDDEVLLFVCDDGPGVSEGNRDKIFRRFFTARPDDGPAGTGLGLAIVAAVARAHHGDLDLLTDAEAAEQELPLRGAAFRVTLPCS